MARFTDELDGLDQEFQRRVPSYASLDVHETEYEQEAVGPGNIQPSGWVVNAATDTGEATVVIDGDGITITEGALTILDQFGATVLTGAGFGQTWLEFLESGLYNAGFGVGTTVDLVGTTMVSDAETEENYLSSLSHDLPYWIFGDIDVSGGGTFHREADSTARSGWCLEWDGNVFGSIAQDMPVVPGQRYAVRLNWRYTNSSSSFTRTIFTQFRKADHSAIGVAQESSLLYSTTQAAYDTEQLGTATTFAPANARYLRVVVLIERTSGNPNVKIAHVGVSPTVQWGNQFIENGDLGLEDGRGIVWGTGPSIVGSDAADKITLNNAYLHISRTTDLVLGDATSGGLVVGDVSGLNIGMDGNEIMARDNGSTSTLFLNNDGGDVQLGGLLSLDSTGAALVQFKGKAQGSGDYGALSGFARMYCLVVAGKHQIRVRFPSGAVQTVATEP